MAVEIAVEPTPNPHAMKFTLNQTVATKGISVASRQSATIYPLAQKLFAIPGIKSLYMMNNFISVTKEPSASWETLTPAIHTVITSHDTSS